MADLYVRNEGTIFIMNPHSNAGRAWIAEHIPEDATRWGKTGIVVEHRYIEAIVCGAIADGLEVMEG